MPNAISKFGSFGSCQSKSFQVQDTLDLELNNPNVFTPLKCSAYFLKMSSKCPKYLHKMLPVCPNHDFRMSQTVLHDVLPVSLICMQDVSLMQPGFLPRSNHDVPKLFPKCPLNVPKMFLRCPRMCIWICY